LDSEWANAPFTSFNYSGHSITPDDVSADYQYYEIADFGDVFKTTGYSTPFHGGEVGFGDFYLGIWTPFSSSEQSFGWVHLAPVNGVLTMINNVMSYKSPGIVIGTKTIVPESTSFFMLAVGVTILLSQVRRGWEGLGS
jgi:hypothetical protein